MPFLMCLLLAYVIVRVSEDVTAAVRRQPPPRQEHRRSKLESRDRQRQNQGHTPKEQTAAGRYFSGLMADSWDSAWHRRELMADQRRANREHRAARKAARQQARQDKRDEKQAARLSTPNGPAPVGFDAEAPQAAHMPDPDQEAAPASVQERVDRWRAALAAGEDTEVFQADEWNTLPSDVRDQLITEAANEGHGTVAHNPDGSVSRLSTQSGPPDNPDTDPEPATPDSPAAATTDEQQEDRQSNVIPFPTINNPRSSTDAAAAPQKMELPSMSTPTGEITGLNSAIQYANDLSTYCAHTGEQVGSVVPTGDEAGASCEQARESLAAGGVTGQPLSDVASVQEQMTAAVTALNQALSQLEAAGAAADSLKNTLTSHLSVQEQYAANPDAGSKEFVTAE